MKKKIIALSVAFSAALLSASALAALDGGQVDFAGLVSDNTCTPHVNGGSQDGQVQLKTAKTADITANTGVADTTPGVMPEKFYITVDCGATTTNTKANLSMASTFFSNANGTLNNDKAIISPASGVNLAIHMVDSSGAAVAYKQVKVNNPADTHQVSFKSGIATFNFVASYVRQASAVPVTPGYVKSNTAYTLTYE